MYENDIELWFNCNKERNASDPNIAGNGAPSGHNKLIDELSDEMVDFSTIIKSKLSAPEVLSVYNKNLKKADLSWVDDEIEDAGIEDMETQKNFDWLEILLMTIFIFLGYVSYKLFYGFIVDPLGIS